MTTLDQRLIADGGVFAEVDTTYLAATSATSATATALPSNVTAYRSYDAGASHYQKNFATQGSFNVSGGTTPGRFVTGWATTLGHWAGNAEAVGFDLIIAAGATAYAAQIRERSGSTNYNATATSNIFTVGASTYYYTFGRYSCLGAKGGAYGAYYSDAALTTFLGAGFKEITHTDNNYQYYYDIQSYNFADANTITGSHSSITESTPTVGEDLTIATETDPPTGQLSVVANCITATNLNIFTSARHVATNHGAGHFTDYKIAGVLCVSAFTNGAVGPMFAILGVTNGAADALVADALQCIDIDYASSTTYKPYIQENVGGVETYSAVGPTLNTGRPYACTLERAGSTLTMKIWNELELDASLNGTSQVGTTVTWTGRATTAYGYRMDVATTNHGATSRSSTFTLGGIKTFVITPIEVTGAETAATGDSSYLTYLDSFSKSATESAATGDTATLTSGFALNATEAAQTGDSAIGGLAGSTDCQETVVTSDSASATVIDTGQKDVSAAEAAAIGDAASVVVGAAVFYRIYWRPVKYDSILAKDIPATALIPKPQFKLLNADDGTTRDFGDPATLFKDASACVDYTDAFLELDATYWPGAHFYPLRTDILPDGRFIGAGEAPDAPGYYTELEELFIRGGVVVDIKSGTSGISLTAAEIVAALAAHEYESGYSHDGVWRAIIALLQSAGTFPTAPGNFIINSPTGKARIRGSIDIAGVRTITSIDLTP